MIVEKKFNEIIGTLSLLHADLNSRCDARNIASAKLATKFLLKHVETIEKYIVVKGNMRDALCFELYRDTWRANARNVFVLNIGQ